MPRSRPARLLVLVPLLVLVLTGCSQVSASVETTRELARDGVKDPVVTIEQDAGYDIVTIDYVSGATDSADLAAEQDRVARTTWRTIDVPVDVVRVHSASDLLGDPPPRTYGRLVLAARFGPRPESVEHANPSSLLTTGLLVMIGIVLLLLTIALVGVLLFIRYRRRRAAVPPWMAGPAYPGWELSEPAARPSSPEPARSWQPARPGHPGYPAAAAPSQAPAQAQPRRPQPEAWPAEDERTTPPEDARRDR